jgi:hypothetical protein
MVKKQKGQVGPLCNAVQVASNHSLRLGSRSNVAAFVVNALEGEGDIFFIEKVSKVSPNGEALKLAAHT